MTTACPAAWQLRTGSALASSFRVATSKGKDSHSTQLQVPAPNTLIFTRQFSCFQRGAARADGERGGLLLSRAGDGDAGDRRGRWQALHHGVHGGGAGHGPRPLPSNFAGDLGSGTQPEPVALPCLPSLITAAPMDVVAEPALPQHPVAFQPDADTHCQRQNRTFLLQNKDVEGQ